VTLNKLATPLRKLSSFAAGGGPAFAFAVVRSLPIQPKTPGCPILRAPDRPTVGEHPPVSGDFPRLLVFFPLPQNFVILTLSVVEGEGPRILLLSLLLLLLVPSVAFDPVPTQKPVKQNLPNRTIKTP
jgi:hypothetical protein